MNIKLDENLPFQLASLLREMAHSVHTLQEERLGRIRELFQNEDVDQWAGCFVVATERKIRVSRRGR